MEPAQFVELTPCRVVDTRNPGGPHGGPRLSAGVSRTFTMTGPCAIPDTAGTLSLNLTVIAPQGPGHLTAWPTGVPEPTVSALNYGAGQTVANAAIVSVGTNGQITVRSVATTHLVIDVNGYFANEVGNGNTVLGERALENLTSGSANTAMGSFALNRLPRGDANTAIGNYALVTLNNGFGNTAVGHFALGGLGITGEVNTAIGAAAMVDFIAGAGNTAIGDATLRYFVAGDNNIAVGTEAGAGLVGGSNNIYIGARPASTDEDDTIRIGSAQTRAFLAGVLGANVTGAPVIVSAEGQIGAMSSSARVKDDIRDMGAASRDLLRLRPVTFRYKAERDGGRRPLQYGLIAEEVAEIYPELVMTDAQGRPLSVAYQLLPAMLLNELQRQQRELEQQKAEAGAKFTAQQQEISDLRQLVQQLLAERMRARH